MKREKILFLGIAIVFIGYLFYSVIEKKSNKERIEGDLSFAIGRLTDYRETGVMESPYVTYKYLIENRFYERDVSSPSFSPCEHDFSLCKNKRFWVAYEKSDPSNSFINLNIELQNIQNPSAPKTLEGFR